MNPLPFLTKEEILKMVDPLTQPAAIRRWFECSGFSHFKIMPCGLPLVPRSFLDQQAGNDVSHGRGPNPDALRERFGKKKSA